MSKYNFLSDKKFLQEIDSLQIKQQYIKITILSWLEQPIKEVQGTVISGSLNITSSSSLRRTGSLNVFLQPNENNDLTDIQGLFSINRKCIIQLGIVNNVPDRLIQILDKDEKTQEVKGIDFQVIDFKQLYGNIVWFPLGYYVMFNPSISQSSSGVTVSMQIKDKMCLLNGDVAGQIPSAINHAWIDVQLDAKEQTITREYTLIYDIIKQLVNHWGNQILSKIVIADVPKQIKQVVKWIGNQTIYLCGKNFNIDPNYLVKSKIEKDNWMATLTSQDNKYVKPIQSGQDIGYIYTDFVYPGELTNNPGDTVTSVLDKIIGVLGNYQYYYDVFGYFIFKEKQNNLNMSYTSFWQRENKKYQNSRSSDDSLSDQQKNKNMAYSDLPSENYNVDYSSSKSTYDFSSNNCVISYNNSLNYNNLKNDFVVWGTIPNSFTGTGSNKLCRYHLAIDKIPILNTHQGIGFYYDNSQIIRGVKLKRNGNTYELPPHRAGLELIKIKDKQGKQTENTVWTRTSVDWREQIYYQMLEAEEKGLDENTQINNSYFAYYAELKEEFPKMFDFINQKYKQEYLYQPLNMVYFLDFIDNKTSQLGKYCVDNIGRRSIVVNDNNEKINCVFQPIIPDVVFLNKDAKSDEIKQIKNKIGIENERKLLYEYGQAYSQVKGEYYQLFVPQTPTYNSCFEKIRDLLYQYTIIDNTVSITTLPIYYLQPNNRITINNPSGGILGDYIIQSITLPLDVSSTMTMNCYKALQKI